jgi:RHS repeat-associated protein
VYDASGKMLAEYSTIVEPPSTAKVSYLTTDHLGSPRILTDANGQLISRRDFHPFGEEIFTAQRTQGLGYTADTVRQKFTSYERDVETDLDYVQARYYSFRLGRFFSVDPENYGASEDDPQSWNGYGYSRSNPIMFVDLDGREYLICDKDRKNCVTQSDAIVKGAQREFPGLFPETGREGHFDMGNILDDDGNVIGTYERISIDPDYQFIYSVAENSIKKAKIAGVLAGVAVVTGVVCGVTAGAGCLAAVGTILRQTVTRTGAAPILS